MIACRQPLTARDMVLNLLNVADIREHGTSNTVSAQVIRRTRPQPGSRSADTPSRPLIALWRKYRPLLSTNE